MIVKVAFDKKNASTTWRDECDISNVESPLVDLNDVVLVISRVRARDIQTSCNPDVIKRALESVG